MCEIANVVKGVALDYAKQGIRCNAICPGWVDTPINHAHAALLGGLEKVREHVERQRDRLGAVLADGGTTSQ